MAGAQVARLRHPAARRHRKCLPACSRAQTCQRWRGVSAFAFQGTNAHVLLHMLPAPEQPGLEAPATTGSPVWHKTRFWLAPQPHALLTRAAWLPLPRAALVHCSLGHAAAAVLLAAPGAPEHELRKPRSVLCSCRCAHPRSGSSECPGLQLLGSLQARRLTGCPCRCKAGRLCRGAALLEATLAAAWAVDGDRAGSTLLLQAAAIPAPLLLPRQATSAGPMVQISRQLPGRLQPGFLPAAGTTDSSPDLPGSTCPASSPQLCRHQPRPGCPRCVGCPAWSASTLPEGARWRAPALPAAGRAAGGATPQPSTAPCTWPCTPGLQTVAHVCQVSPPPHGAACPSQRGASLPACSRGWPDVESMQHERPPSWHACDWQRNAQEAWQAFQLGAEAQPGLRPQWHRRSRRGQPAARRLQGAHLPACRQQGWQHVQSGRPARQGRVRRCSPPCWHRWERPLCLARAMTARLA